MLTITTKLTRFVPNNKHAIGFFLIGLLSFLYSRWFRGFAKIHINIPGLNIPIFIGELVLIFCLIIAERELLKEIYQTKKLLILATAFTSFILLKILIGLITWGPLALRHSAIFYYMLFLGFGYVFYDKKLINNRALLNILFIFMYLMVVTVKFINHYYFYTYWMLLLVLSLYLSKNKTERFLRILCVIFLIIKYPYLETPRALLASFIAAFFVLIAAIFLSLKIQKKFKVGLILIFCLLVASTFLLKQTRKYAFDYFAIGKIKEQYLSYKEKGPNLDKYHGYNETILFQPTMRKPQPPKKEDAKEGHLDLFISKKINDAYSLIYQETKEINLFIASPAIKKQSVSKEDKENFDTKVKTINDLHSKFILVGEEINYYMLNEAKRIHPPLPDEIDKLKDLVIKLSKLNKLINNFVASKEDELSKQDDSPEILLARDIKRKQPTSSQKSNTEEADIVFDHHPEILQSELMKIEVYVDENKKNLANLPEKMKEISKRSLPVLHSSNNVLWRIFVWEDLLKDLLKTNIIIGVDLGKPLRSPQAEKLGWYYGSETGWIEPHNSFLNILYRTGLIGMSLIVFIWFLWGKVLFFFITHKDTKGVILTSILLYWLVIANFMVILEIPYFAVPFWSLFGLTLAYSLKRKQEI